MDEDFTDFFLVAFFSDVEDDFCCWEEDIFCDDDCCMDDSADSWWNSELELDCSTLDELDADFDADTDDFLSDDELEECCVTDDFLTSTEEDFSLFENFRDCEEDFIWTPKIKITEK